MQSLSIKKIEEKIIFSKENSLEKQYELTFNSDENKTIVLKGKGSLKQLSSVK